MHGHESRELDVGLEQVEQVLHLEVVHRQIEVRDPIRRQKSIGIDPPRCAIAQLEVDHLDARGAPANRRWMRRRPGRRVEPQEQVGEAQLAPIGVEHIVALEPILALVTLPHAQLGAPRPSTHPRRGVVAHPRVDAVEGEACRRDRVPLQPHRERRRRCPHVRPGVLADDASRRVPMDVDLVGLQSAANVEALDVAAQRSCRVQRAGDGYRHRLRGVDDEPRHRSAGCQPLDFRCLGDTARVGARPAHGTSHDTGTRRDGARIGSGVRKQTVERRERVDVYVVVQRAAARRDETECAIRVDERVCSGEVKPLDVRQTIRDRHAHRTRIHGDAIPR